MVNSKSGNEVIARSKRSFIVLGLLVLIVIYLHKNLNSFPVSITDIISTGYAIIEIIKIRQKFTAQHKLHGIIILLE